MMKPQVVAIMGIVMWCVSLFGCGAKLATVPVHGKVTFNGGSCPAAGHITFSPLEVAAGMPRRPGSAQFDRDGCFKATSFAKGDGLLPGHYEVLISCFDGVPDASKPNAFRDANFVPAAYKPERLIIEAGADPIEVRYDVPLKKK
ncbi:MAG: hypothetical protein HYX69_20775 [Planctomycetia bacterium]|nr:hypothetical protein [Planctomycetia bacterium]